MKKILSFLFAATLLSVAMAQKSAPAFNTPATLRAMLADDEEPVATDTIEVNVPDAHILTRAISSFDPMGCFWDGISDDEAYNVSLAYWGMSFTGTFDGTVVMALSNVNGVSLLDAMITVTATVNHGYTLEAYLLGQDLHCYHVNMVYTQPAMESAQDTIEVLIPIALGLLDQVSQQGWFQIKGWTPDSTYFVSFSNSGVLTSIVGEFDYDGFDVPYCFIRIYGDDTIQVQPANGHASMSDIEGGYFFEAYYLSQELHCYHITMPYYLPTLADATDTIDWVIPAARMDNRVSDYGLFQMYGRTADQLNLVFLEVHSSQVEGDYEFSDFNPELAYVLLDIHGSAYTKVNAIAGRATVTATETGYEMETYLLGEDYHCYHAVLTYSNSSIVNASQVQVNVYPNPATDVLHVEADGITRLDILDAAGRIVLTRNQNEATLELGSLPKGVYMLRTTTIQGVNLQKIVKQ